MYVHSSIRQSFPSQGIENMETKKSTKELFHQCLSETSIHGFRYTVDKQFHICENVLWTVLTLGFLSLGIYLVHVCILPVFYEILKPTLEFQI